MNIVNNELKLLIVLELILQIISNISTQVNDIGAT